MSSNTTIIYSRSALVISYSDQLSSRFHSNSMACEVLIGLLAIMMLVVEIVKIIKKTYEWQNEFEVNLDQKYADESKIAIKYTQAEPIDNQNENKMKEENQKIE